MHYLRTVILLLLIIQTNRIGSVQHSKLWKEPDAWGRVKVPANDIIDGSGNKEECKCSIAAEECDDDANKLSIIYYRKILNLLFNKDNFNEDEIGIYTRRLQLTLSSEQIKVLKDSKDPRDWDAIVSNVFKNAEQIKFPNLMPSNGNFIVITFKWLKEILIDFNLMPEFSFLMFTVVFICTIIYINKKYNYGFIVIFLILCFLSGFAYTYNECNKQLEIEELAALLDSEGDDPCQNIQSEKKNWSVWNIFSRKSTKEQCIAHLKKKHKTELSFCLPDKVFLIYVNEIILDQFQRIVEKCTNIFKSTLENIPFPYNLVAVTIFACMLPLFLKMLFQHIFDPRVWLQNSSNNIPTQQPVVVEKNGNELLNKLILEKLEYHQKKTDAKLINLERSISGVQILDAIENPQQKVLTTSNGENLSSTAEIPEIPEIVKTSKSENSLNDKLVDQNSKPNNSDV